MKKKLNKYGFSMAELLIVVAILVALFGVAFVAVQNHQRSMTQLEYDTIAKEIFIAAQNHLTTAESQGYLGQIADESGYGIKSPFKDEKNDDETDKVYYFTVTKGTIDRGTMLDLMLPFGSIDETIRAGGSYIIRYQPSSARVLDVFYSNPGPVTAWLTLKGAKLDDHYNELMPLRGEENKAARRKCDQIGGAVVGWYGDGDALPLGDRLEAPQVLIHNEETLWVEVKDTSSEGSLVLIVTGETSEAKKAFYLRGLYDSISSNPDKDRISDNYKIVLDDITRFDSDNREGLHFAEIVADTSEKFIPGENITVEAVAYNNSALTNIAYSGKGRTNSIFADPSSYEVVPAADLAALELNKVNGTVVYNDDKDSATNPIGIAAVANFRHLENLDKFVSGLGKGEELEYISAVQLTNLSESLSWTGFIGEDNDKTGECIFANGIDTGGNSGKYQYWPVNLEEDFLYDGRGHSISDVVTDGSAPGEDKNVGLFRTLNGGTVKNLELIDFTIKGSDNTEANAGALAGAASGSAITNVLVRNSKDQDSKFSENNNIITKASAGGLIGSMSSGSVTGCAAAVYVSGGTNAGGLIGEVTSGTVTACYSGGHTDKASYINGTIQFDDKGKPDPDCCIFNVKASGSAGGLIGSSSETDILYSYSTCSVTGSTAGGFVGNVSAKSTSESISFCYATGLVSGETEGAFAGTCGSDTASNCYYYQIINERKDKEKGYKYLWPISETETVNGIEAFDKTAKTYNDFSLPNEDGYSWQPAVPYDEALKNYYNVQEGKIVYNVYNLKTVKQLVALDPNSSVSINDDDLVTTHYGDWPAPEIFVINQ